MVELIIQVFSFHLCLSVPLTIWLLIWLLFNKMPVQKTRATQHCSWMICLAGLFIIPLLLAFFSLFKLNFKMSGSISIDNEPAQAELDNQSLPSGETAAGNSATSGQKSPEVITAEAVKSIPTVLPVDKKRTIFVIQLNTGNTISKIGDNIRESFPEFPEALINAVEFFAGIIYLAGLLFFLLRIVLDFYSLYRTKNDSSVVENEAIADLFYALQVEMELSWPVKLLQNKRIKIPVSFGLHKNYIILPLALVRQGDLSLLRAILIHELAHIQRRDWIILIFRRIVQALFFYHPLIWYINAAVAECQEDICDSWVVNLGTVREEYARKLVEFVYADWDNVPRFASTIIHWPGSLKVRIKSIIHSHASGQRGLHPGIRILLFVISFFFLAGISLLWSQFGWISDSLDLTRITDTIPDQKAGFYDEKSIDYVPEDLKIMYDIKSNTRLTEELEKHLLDIKDKYRQQRASLTWQDACREALVRLDDLDRISVETGNKNDKKIDSLHILIARLYYSIPLFSDSYRQQEFHRLAVQLLQTAADVYDRRLLASLLTYPPLTGDYRNQVKHLETARVIYELLDDKEKAADMLFRKGELLFSEKDYKAAGKNFIQARRKYLEAEIFDRAATASAAVNLVAFTLEKPDAAFKAYGYNGFSFSINKGYMLDKYDIFYGKKFSQSVFDKRDAFEYFPWSFSILTFISPLLMKDGMGQDSRLDMPTSETGKDSIIVTHAQVENKEAALIVPFMDNPLKTRQISLTQSIVTIKNGSADYDNGKVVRTINFWFAPGIGLIRYVYSDTDGDQFTWELADYKFPEIPDTPLIYFPAAPGMQWDYIYKELKNAGVEHKFHLTCESEDKRIFYFSLVSAAWQVAYEDDFKYLGTIDSSSGKYVGYYDTRGVLSEYRFNNPYSPDRIAAGKLIISFTNNDPVGYLRALNFSLNDKPFMGSRSIGVYGLSPGQGKGFVAQMEETVEWEMDMADAEFPKDIPPGSVHINLLNFLQQGENRIKAWVTSDNKGYGSSVSIRLGVKMKPE